MKISILRPQVIHELGSRNNQEDSVFPKLNEVSEDDRLFILCDGMGGHDNGEVASLLVCDVLSAYIKEHWNGDFFSDKLFLNALDEVFCKIDEYDSESLKKMGTTLTFLCLHRGGAFMAYIGDSRIYHIRPSEHLILYKSRDHSLAYDLLVAGEISYEELTTYKKNVITRAIMPGMESKPLADIVHTTDIREGDYFLLCSDGLLEQMNDDELLSILSSDLTDEEKRNVLMNKTKENKDNHSAFIVRISNAYNEEQGFQYSNDELISTSNAMILEKKLLVKEESKDLNPQGKLHKMSVLRVILLIVFFVIVSILLKIFL